jgi:dienelactone hydrolase
MNEIYTIKTMRIFYPIIFFASFAYGCAGTTTSRSELIPETFHATVINRGMDYRAFSKDGPYKIIISKNVSTNLPNGSTVLVDIHKPDTAQPIPLIIFSHGNHSDKDAHRNQARRLASWGFASVTLKLPNRDQWLTNGKRISEIVKTFYNNPNLVASNMIVNKILLAGHSFGGSAVTLAAAMETPVAGIILLDPAVVHPKVIDMIKRVKPPVILIGADASVFRSKKRRDFFANMTSEMCEISVAGATHDDAQDPSMFEKSALGTDPFTDDARRAVFTSSIVAAAISLSSSGATLPFRQFIASGLNDNTFKKLLTKGPSGNNGNISRPTSRDL